MRAFVVAAGLALGGCAAGPRWEPCANEICARCQGSAGYECKKCGSTGYVDCTSCRKGKQTCRWCGGIGYEWTGIARKCVSCFGRGRISCRRCHETLAAPCRTCEGTGRAKCGRWIEPPDDRALRAPPEP